MPWLQAWSDHLRYEIIMDIRKMAEKIRWPGGKNLLWKGKEIEA